jgi:hypothetical protein
MFPEEGRSAPLMGRTRRPLIVIASVRLPLLSVVNVTVKDVVPRVCDIAVMSRPAVHEAVPLVLSNSQFVGGLITIVASV